MIDPFNSNPLISIIITSYNRATLISKTIESALLQDYHNIEIVISDDGSTDGSDSIIKKYTSDPRVRYFRNESNIGMLPNFKLATYDLAKGDYVTYVSSDDYFIDPSFISNSVRLINENENICLVFGRYQFINPQGKILRVSPISPFFTKTLWSGKDVFFESPNYGILSWGACVIRRKDLIAVHGLQNNFVATDVDVNYKVMFHGNVCFINKVSYEALIHSDNASGRVNAKEKILHMECIKRVVNYAKCHIPEQASKIDEWGHFYFFAHAYNELKYLKSRSNKEYLIFREFLQAEYHDLYREVKSRWRFNIFIILQSVKNLFKLS